jgi:hypothetical protein
VYEHADAELALAGHPPGHRNVGKHDGGAEGSADSGGVKVAI